MSGAENITIVNISSADLTLVLVEAALELKAPAGLSSEEALQCIGANRPEFIDAMHRVALAAVDYIMDRMKAGGAVFTVLPAPEDRH